MPRYGIIDKVLSEAFSYGLSLLHRRNFTSAVCPASVWLVYTTARPVATRYLVTPEKYGRLSARGAQVTLVAAEQIAGLQFTDAQREMML